MTYNLNIDNQLMEALFLYFSKYPDCFRHSCIPAPNGVCVRLNIGEYEHTMVVLLNRRMTRTLIIKYSIGNWFIIVTYIETLFKK